MVENPIDAVFDFDETLGINFKSFLLGDPDNPILAQIDPRLAPLIVLMPDDSWLDLRQLEKFMRSAPYAGRLL